MKNLFFLSLFLTGIFSFSQVSIGVTDPHASSIIEISNSNKGLLIPRMDQTQINGVLNPIESLMSYNLTSNIFQANNGVVWNQESFYTNEFWNKLGNKISVTGQTFHVGTRESRLFKIKTNNGDAINIQANVQVRLEGRDLEEPRLVVKSAGIGTTRPSISAQHSSGFGASEPHPNDLIAVNSGVSTLKGNFAFAQTETDALIGNSIAGISFVSAGSPNDGISFYLGGHPTSTTDFSLEKMRITTEGNIGIATLDPKSKLQVEDGDIFIADPSRGIVIRSSSTTCHRLTVNNSGVLTPSPITCP